MNMKIRTASIATWLSLLSITSYGYYTEYVDGVEWRYEINDDNTVTIGSDNWDDAWTAVDDSITFTDLYIPETLGGYTVTTIGDRAFADCWNIDTLHIPSSVVSINNIGGWFNGNSVEVDSANARYKGFDGGLYEYDELVWFSGNKGSLEIPSWGRVSSSDIFTQNYNPNLYDINVLDGNETLCSFDGALYNINYTTLIYCPRYKKHIDIPETVTMIGDRAFQYSNVYSVNLPSGLKTIGSEAFWGSNIVSIDIPDNVIDIGSAAFGSCYYLKSVTIPGSIASVREGWFNGCNSLTSVTLKEGIKVICYGAFRNCCSLASVSIPNSVTVIASEAFWGCVGLGQGRVVIDGWLVKVSEADNDITSVVIPDDVKNIACGVFYGCTNLCEITNLPTEKLYMFNVVNGYDGECLMLTNVVIRSGSSSIYPHAFYSCRNLSSITIPNSVTNIGEGAFECCDALGSGIVYVDGCLITINGTCPDRVNLPEGTRLIGDAMFANRTELVSLSIPTGGVQVGINAFTGCTNLERIEVARIEDWNATVFDRAEDNPLLHGAHLYVNGIAQQITVLLDTNDGQIESQRTLLMGDVYGDLPVLSKDGSCFMGWYTMPDGGMQVSDSEHLLSNCTLYAHFVSIMDLKVFSGYPWREVILGYTIKGFLDHPTALNVMATDNDTCKIYECATLEGVDLSEGVHTIKWKAELDGAKFMSTNVVFTMRLIYPMYCVIDLSGGPDAVQYPVSYLADVPVGGWTDEYKSTKLVLRRCSAGADPLGRYTLTKDFFAGVFEVTQKQWYLVMGRHQWYSDSGDTYPTYYVSYNDIRGSSAGANCPSSSSVDATSFIGKLRTKTGLSELDLPTEAQWEYACRAGTTTTYNLGDGDSALAAAGWYSSNSSSAMHPVGQKTANAWGLYDMHGNVWEWCLNWYQPSSLSGSDPKGAASGSNRVYRGGSWIDDAGDCTSSCRSYYYPSYSYLSLGFRLFRTLP